MITIIDYKSGNIRSISNGFKKIGVDVELTDDPEKLADADYLVLPGVGSFGASMENLEPFKDIIYEHINDDKPFLGICLGLQVLLSSSDETSNVKGLDIFKGHVKRLPKGLKIPHMGWNKLNLVRPCPILEGMDGKYFYFVHSYYANPDNEENIVATCEYGFDVPAALYENNVYATQFHPEKSGKIGLKILKNFVNLKD
ncbi:imidazole glycerol phosphate synthase subunit HisH [Methanobrevibacter sp. 87.7]|uniref:imidazole glycerol phosphate synthase subunit HisH n=1 Tax=Methanobrevibacter sp. 87.7 TaxID=387957 RepID=UPI000B503C38|nr:imidazole glycerol phosphate synthase subunit HisH [Methanobrevibacter sp. 87.7]OWT33421.1 imidazole glycerol phosphate synthase subunit HisH [Methanobrevibacter sp. 87.7]